MSTIPMQRIYEGHLLSGDRRVFFRHFGTFCNVGCSVGFHVDTNVLSTESHNCGISSFFPNFTSVRGIDVLLYVAVNALFQRWYFYVGLRGANA
jgi:hypothetical protein